MTDPTVPPTDPAPSPRSRLRLLVTAGLAVVGVLLAVGLWLSYRPVPDQIQGMVDAHDVRITSKVTGRIARFMVEEGQVVQAGQLLYTLDSPEVTAKTQQAGGALAAAKAQQDKASEGARPEDLRSAEAQWRRAQAGADFAQTTFVRVQRLYDQGVMTGQKRDEARANAVSSTEQARAARAQYDLALSGTRTEDKQAAGGQVQQARGAVAEVQAAVAETHVVAPSAGEIGRRLAQPGELVPQGFPVFMLTDVGHPWVTVNVREDQLNGLRQGVVVIGTVPALGGKGARFRVSYTAPAGDFATWRATRQSTGFDVKSFEIRLTPLNLIAGLRPGMTVLFDWPQ